MASCECGSRISPPTPAPRAVARPPVAPAPLSEILEPHSQLAMMPPAAELKLKSEAASPPPAIGRPLAPPKPVALASAGIHIAASPTPPAARRTATVAAPPPQARSSSKKWLLIGAGVIAVAIGAATAARPWFNQPPPAPIEVEGPRIEAAMGAYRSAYRNRNLEGVVKVFPELPADTKRTMEQAFTNCLVYEVTFADMKVALAADPNSAEVDVLSTYNCTPTSGGRQSETSRHEVFSLKKIGDDWLISGAVPVSAGRPQ